MTPREMNTPHSIRQAIFRAMPINREVTKNDMLNRMKGELPKGFSEMDMSRSLGVMVAHGSILSDTHKEFTLYKRIA